MPLGESLQKYTYQFLLEKALSLVPESIDKREGSIIYDALAPACYMLAEYFMEMHRLAQEVSIETASGEWLDDKVVEVGISRNQATPAVKKATFTAVDINGNSVPISVPIGSRFATISDTQPLYYVVTDTYKDEETGVVEPGSYELTCMSTGIEGNHYTGTIVPLDFIQDLATAELGDYIIPGADAESDDDLRERYLTKVRYRAFGGNIAQYRELALSIDNGAIGGVQVYPTWNGGGTVKLSIVDSDHKAIPKKADGSPGDFVIRVQNIIDPDANGLGGTGLGSAPIDHRVTVVTPEEYFVDISADVWLGNQTIDQVRPQIIAAIEAYFNQLRTDWDRGSELNEYSMTIYQSQIVRAALSAGVNDFSNVVLRKSGTSEALTNITLIENGTTQQLPMLGEVTLNVKS